MLSLRISLLTLLLLSLSPLLKKSTFTPASAPTERSSLLGDGPLSSATYGTAGENGKPSKPRNMLRSSQPPSNRPPDPKSLSILTLFSRVRTLFPYLWPSKSVGLQILALVCIGLMLLKRFVNVLVPIYFGRIISDLAAARRASFVWLMEPARALIIPLCRAAPYVSIATYVLVSFLRASCSLPRQVIDSNTNYPPEDSNSMLYRYLWLPIEQYSEREMTMLSFDCLLKCVAP